MTKKQVKPGRPKMQESLKKVQVIFYVPKCMKVAFKREVDNILDKYSLSK